MWPVKLLLALAVAYAALALLAYAAQTSLLFPTSLARGSPSLPSDAQRVACETPDGERLQGLRMSPAAGSGRQRTIVLAFGGNAWNADDMAIYLHERLPEAEVVAFHYRGYRPSTGRPSAAALLEDAPLLYDCMIKPMISAKVVVVGFSIGSGVAAHLARERSVDGVILVTPIDSLEQLARQHYGWLPIKLLLRHHMSPLEDLREVTAPVVLIAGERDTIIPGQRTAPLRKAAPNLIMDKTIAGAGHNDIYSNPEFVRAMRQALELIESVSSESGE
jgi:pimeloyl-ACP methyl ester carboxylesterase